MKTLLTILFGVLLSVNAQSQNMVGQSWSDVYKFVYSKGYIVDNGTTDTEDKFPYISAKDDIALRIYYFAKNNMCIMSILIVNGATFDMYESSLLKEGYRRLGNKYYMDDYVAEIILYGEDNINVLRITLK